MNLSSNNLTSLNNITYVNVTKGGSEYSNIAYRDFSIEGSVV